jgi:hypothetical protein
MKRFLCLALLFVFTCIARAAEPPPLERAEATRILDAMNWTEVTIVSVRQGVDAKGSVAPIYATILGFGRMQGQLRNICQTIYFDRELNWHALEMTDKKARVWTRDGYREIKPWGTW